MIITELLKDLSEKGIQLWAEDNHLRYRAPQGVLTPAILDILRHHKAEVIEQLHLIATQKEISSQPLSHGQKALWFLYELAPDSVAYNLFATVRISSVVDINKLNFAWQILLQRHPILRTVYKTHNDRPVQVLKEPKVDISLIDAVSWNKDNFNTEILAEADRPFNLEDGPILHLSLYARSPQEYILLLVVHHIAFDFWSFDLLIHEFRILYQEIVQKGQNFSPHCLPLCLSYTDYSNWLQRNLESIEGERLWDYWQEKLAGELPILHLHTDKTRPPVQTYAGANYTVNLDEKLVQKLKALAKTEGTTLYTTLIAVFQVLLYRYTGQEDILVGTPTLGRDLAEFERIIGYFTNPVVVRGDVSGNPTFKEFLARIRQTVLEALSNSTYPFPLLVEKLNVERDPSRSPIFQVSFTFNELRRNTLAQSSGVSELEIETLTMGQRGAGFDLDLMVLNQAGSLVFNWVYNTDLFDAATIERMAEHFQSLLAGVIANPQQPISKLPLLTELERHQLLVKWNNTSAEYPQDKCIHQLFENQVERTPEAVAVVFEEEQLTYLELNAKANQLALYLRSLGVGPEVLVGICVERSFDMIVGILGILKAGGAYVPIDPAYPSERIGYMLDDSQLPVLLTQKQLVASLPEHQARVVCLDSDWEEISTESELFPITDLTSQNLAYVIYTSGSTGKPKGVKVAHRGLCNLATAQIKLFDVHNNSCVLQFASLSFDASISEIVIALCAGATLCLGTREELQPGQPLWRVLQKQRITHVTLVPSALAALPPQQLPALETIVVAGEPCPPNLVAQWATGRRFLNAYGPTESTVCATAAQYFGGMDVLPIGRPIANTQIYILDRHKQPVPIGVRGELHIAGVGLARGYLNRPELTDEKFIPNPFSNKAGSRLYKTGDLARYLPDGNIEYIGRIDNQVKIRGFRIELGEIEAVLAKHPNVREVAVIDREETPGNKRLVAYLVSNLIPERIPYHSECQLELDGNAITLHTQDISSGGVGVMGVPVLDEGSSVRLHLQLPGEAEPRWLCGTVVWSSPPMAGILFHLTPNQQAQVDQSVAYQLEIQELWKTLQRTVTGNLRDYLKQKLPDYMIPSAFVLMKSLPLTPNGKVDRRALPALLSFHKEREDKFVAPSTPTEEILATIWVEVLGIQQVSINDNFFELGGHSLIATSVISRIREAFSIEMKVRHLFEAPTIASLSKIIDTARFVDSHEQSSNSKAIDVLPRSSSAQNTYIPMSFAQQYVWDFQQLYSDSCAYNCPTALRLTGKISLEALEKSINEIIRRHEILRTNFTVVDEQSVQVITSSLTIPLKIVNLQNLPESQREAEAEALTAREFQHQFDLVSDPLVKTTLLGLAPQEHWLLITMHHIITDGWSYGIFLQELGTLYNAFSNGLPSPLREVSLQYADFTLWERQWLTEELLQKQLDYWLQKLADIPASLNLLPRGQPQVSSFFKPASFYSLVLPESLVASIKALSRSRRVTIFVTLIAALKLLLYKGCGQSHVLILARTANRLRPTIEKMLGCFINDVLLRSQVDDSQTGLMLLEQVNQTVTEAIANQEIPLQRVVKAVSEISPIQSLRTVSVSMAPPAFLQSQKLKWERIFVPIESELWDEQHFPLEIYIHFSGEDSNTIEIVAFYSKRVYTDKTIKLLFSGYLEILQKLVELPDTQVCAFEPSESLY